MNRLDTDTTTDRPTFLRGLAAAGATLAGLRRHSPHGAPERVAAGLTGADRAILRAAQVAEALAVTTYDHIITVSPLFAYLFPQDQVYMRAALQEEMAHYQLLHGLTGAPTPYTAFYYPRGMFATARTTLDTLVTLEEAFIAAYLVGVRDFSTPNLRVAAARIMGVESDHRTMARVLAPGLDPAVGGPLRTLNGFTGTPEAVDPANNSGFERTLGWTRIDQAMTALRPFIDKSAAASAQFDTSKAYPFRAFKPTLPTPLGGF
jgi:hypothetical protein